MASTHCLSSGAPLHRVDSLLRQASPRDDKASCCPCLACVIPQLASEKKEQHCLALSKQPVASKGLFGSHDRPRTTDLTESGSRVQLCGKA